jgi:hypothetical protein
MSTNYQSTKEVPLDAIIARLRELSDAIIRGRDAQADEFTMRIPAECDRDADLVLSEAANRLNAMQARVADLKESSGMKANLCMEWKVANNKAMGRMAELEASLSEMVEMMDCNDEHGEGSPWHVSAKKALSGSNNAWLLRQKADAIDEAARMCMPTRWGAIDDAPAGFQEYCDGVASVRDYADNLRIKDDKAGGGA